MTEVMPWENLPKTNRSKTQSEIRKERIRGRKTPTSSKTAPHKPLTVDGKTVFNVSELMIKRKSGETLTELESKVLDDYLMHENCKKLTEKSKPSPTLAEVKAKMARGEKLTKEETNVLLADIKKTEAEYAALRNTQKVKRGLPLTLYEELVLHGGHSKTNLKSIDGSYEYYGPKGTAKTEFSIPYPTASDLYFQQKGASRKMENEMRTKSTGYRPLNDRPKGGLERWMEKFGELAEKKAELTENNSKIADKFAKILEFLKKYSKSYKA